MNVVKKITAYCFTACLLLAAPMSGLAYEVNVLTGAGSESKALDRGDYKVAIKRLERRIEHGTGDTDIQLTNLCTAYVVTGRFDKAEDVCDKAVEANGEFVGTAYNSRGVLHSLKGDYVAAMADFEKAGDKANYPRAREDWGDKAPSNRRFSGEEETENAVAMAWKNHGEADRVLVAKQAE